MTPPRREVVKGEPQNLDILFGWGVGPTLYSTPCKNRVASLIGRQPHTLSPITAGPCPLLPSPRRQRKNITNLPQHHRLFVFVLTTTTSPISPPTPPRPHPSPLSA